MSIFKNGINIPKIVKELKLGDYAPELQKKSIRVWVNPTLALHDEYAKLQLAALQDGEKRTKTLNQFKELDGKKDRKKVNKLNKQLQSMEKGFEALNDDFYKWYSEIWSQDELKETHASPKEVRKIAKSSLEQEGGAFWGWLTQKTQAMILAHRNSYLKN